MNIFMGYFSQEQRDTLDDIAEMWEFRNMRPENNHYWIRHHEYPYEEGPYFWFWQIVWHIRRKQLLEKLGWIWVGMLVFDVFLFLVFHLTQNLALTIAVASVTIATGYLVLANIIDDKVAYDRKMQEMKDAEAARREQQEALTAYREADHD